MGAAPDTLSASWSAAEGLVATATHAFGTGDLKQTAALCQQAIGTCESYAPAYALMSQLFEKLNNGDSALKFIELALQFDPNSPQYRTRKAQMIGARGKYAEAVEILKDVTKAEPSPLEAWLLLGNMYGILGQEAAMAATYRELRQFYADPIVDEYEAMGLITLRRWEKARVLLEKLLEQQPHNPRALTGMAKVVQEKGDQAQATVYLNRALACGPIPATYYLLSVQAYQNEQLEEAFKLLNKAIEGEPGNVDYRMLMASIAQGLGTAADVENQLRIVLQQNPDHVPAMAALAGILSPTGRHEEAKQLAERVLARDPNHVSAKHLYQALCGVTPETTAPEYVAELFDAYASNFEHHLVEKLGYHVPSYLRQMVQELRPEWKSVSLFDMGCGTGLMAQELKDMTARRVGVDLSPKMIEQAEKKGLYEKAYVGDAVESLKKDPSSYELIIAADVLVYIGALEKLFAAAKSHLAAEGLFMFSIEIGEDNHDYTLRPSGRYAHSARYVERLAAEHGFTIAAKKETPLRREAKGQLNAMLYALST